VGSEENSRKPFTMGQKKHAKNTLSLPIILEKLHLEQKRKRNLETFAKQEPRRPWEK
jgi:hypothetical protein